jgi:hypothetical protein
MPDMTAVPPERLRVLIVGGYGTFGGRLAQLLAYESKLEILVAGRSQKKAASFCASLAAKALTVPIAFDRNGDIEAQIEALVPDIVVDASGPFQAYGGDPYRLVRACLTQGVDYLDLADGSEFVDGITQFDDAARKRQICILSGVSSFPVLTAAVVDALSHGFSRIDAVIGGIAPSPYAGVGLNVIRAIAGYAGQPVRLVRNGQRSIGYAFCETMRYTIAPPGRLPLGNIRFSLVDVPDLHVLPTLWPALSSVWMGAGPVPEVLHRALNGLAWLVRLRLLPTLSPFARIFHHAINVLRWGEHRGGMFVRVEGLSKTGTPTERSWHLLAEGDDGPLIPSMAIEGIIRHRLAGRRPANGARAAARDLTLQDYDLLFAQRAICTGIREADDPRMPLYRRILGDAWSRLPEPIQAMHSVAEAVTADGKASVERGHGLLSRLTAAVFRFPPAGDGLPVTVSLTSANGAERWRRRFADHQFESWQTEGSGRSARLIDERFGPFTFSLALVLEDARLRLVLRRWKFLGLPLPMWLAPRNDSYETAEQGRFGFHVEIGHPLTGLIVRYRGWLIPRRPG